MAMDQITVLLGGDLHVQRENPESIFAHVIEELRKADIRFGNLEMMLTDIRKPLGGREVDRLVSDERMLAAYTYAGFDAVGLANNHSMDQGIEGLLRCIELLDAAGIIHTGGGPSLAEARRPAIVERNGASVAFLSYTSVFHPSYAATDVRGGLSTIRATTNYEPHRLVDEAPGSPPTVRTQPDPADLARLAGDVKVARSQVQVVIVSCHWGLSPLTGGDAMIPVQEYQTAIAHAAIDAGADLVLGHHPHMLQGIEVYRGKTILYSVGNYAFDFFVGGRLTTDTRLQTAALVKVAIRNGAIERVGVIPVCINVEGQPIPQRPADAPDIVQILRELSEPLGTRLEAGAEDLRVALPAPVAVS